MHNISLVSELIHIPWAFIIETCINRQWQPPECPILFSGPTQEPAKATTNTGQPRERFEKNEGEWIGKVEISWRKKSLAVGEACVAMY